MGENGLGKWSSLHLFCWVRATPRPGRRGVYAAPAAASSMVYRLTMSLFQLDGKYLLLAAYCSGGGTWTVVHMAHSV